MAFQTSLPADQKNERTAFIIISVLMLILMPALSHYYGQSGDEWLQIEYGRDIWNYFTHVNEQALDYTNQNLQHSHQELYGGLFDFPMDVLHHWLPSVPILYLRHFFNALLGALMMVFTGLLTVRISRSWMAGIVGLLFIFFSPRIFGESMNNPKDIPFAAGFVIGIYFLVAFLQDFPRFAWRQCIGLMLGWGLAFGVRSAGGILLLAYIFLFTALYYMLHPAFRQMLKENANKNRNRALLVLSVALIGGYIIGLACWPWGLQSPISHPIEALQGMTNREINIRTIFEGKFYFSQHMPWYYELKWICISNPLVVLFGLALFFILILQIKKRLGLFTVILVLFGAFFPLLYMMYKHSTVYDTWRHVFFVYPFWVIGGALGWAAIGDFLNEKLANKEAPVKPRFIWPAIAIIGLLPTMLWTYSAHPNQYVYFNEFTGGIRGAFGNYELDYYENSGLQDAQWIMQHAKQLPGRKIIVRSNLSSYGFSRYFAPDSSWIGNDYGRYAERHAQVWDYFVSNGRFISPEQLKAGIWPPQHVVHRVEVDGVPLSVVIQRTDTSGVAAAKAYNAKDYATAAPLYATLLKSDTTDEAAYLNAAVSFASVNQLEPALDAAQHAVRLAPDNPQYYELLAQLYHAKGDDAHAQEAMNKGKAIAEEQQENEEE